MTGRVWKPGDVAMVTWHAMGESRTDLRFRYARKMVGEVWESPDGSWIGDSSAKVVRPLVVIDPEDREQVKRLDDLIYSDRFDRESTVDGTQAALREFANPTPAKPKEPTGLGAVVEDADGVRWVRARRDEHQWRHDYEDGRPLYHPWSAIAVVRVLSEGVEVAQ